MAFGQWDQKAFNNALRMKYENQAAESAARTTSANAAMMNAETNRQNSLRGSFADRAAADTNRFNAVTDRFRNVSEFGNRNPADLLAGGISLRDMSGSFTAPRTRGALSGLRSLTAPPPISGQSSSVVGAPAPQFASIERAEEQPDPYTDPEKTQGLAKGGQVKKMTVDMSGYNAGGMVKQPGYAHSGKVHTYGYGDGGSVGMRGYMCGGPVKTRPPGGYARGGAIGDVAEDDGRDTIDAAVRPGEYLLNPETVEYVGGGDYDQGVEMLDNLVVEATGEEPGPEPVDENGEPVMMAAKGGKMGYARSGYIVGDTAAAELDEIRRQAQQGRGPTPTQSEPAQPARRSLRQTVNRAFGNPNMDPVRMNMPKPVTATGRGLAKAAELTGRGLTKLAPAAAVVNEGLDISKVASDDDSTALDVAAQTGRAATRLSSAYLGAKGGATLGAAIGTAFPPIAPVTVPLFAAGGGLTGYFGSDYLMDQAAGESPAARVAARDIAEPQAALAARQAAAEQAAAQQAAAQQAAAAEALYAATPRYVDPQGNIIEGFVGEGPVNAGNQSLANFLAREGREAGLGLGAGAAPNAGMRQAIPGTNAEYAGRYGGQEVVATVGPDGETVFTGLRTVPQVEAQAAAAAAPVDPVATALRGMLESGNPAQVKEAISLINDRREIELDARPKAPDAEIGDMMKMLDATFRTTDADNNPIVDEVAKSEFLGQMDDAELRQLARSPELASRAANEFLSRRLINRRLNTSRSETARTNLSNALPTQMSLRPMEWMDVFDRGVDLTDKLFGPDYVLAAQEGGEDLVVPADRALRDAIATLAKGNR